ncbi:hypothetical protein [Rhodococcus sp. HNM0569]|uniref:hypothetical protein n=1 Tax=Rhodococcus sp. HNM0569 TaxID=2716340 RepID=UPI00146BCF5A|nr:hypothetical protein [Rhodococcus sp. HNM0569]NLU84988.1 hypothetical protein [Rhodococcus sp. HNM0569]
MTDAVSGVDNLLALAAQAKAGELVLDPEVAQDCAKASQDAIASLHEVRERMKLHTKLLPLGNFDCGHELAQILSDTTQQFIDRLAEHITCLEAIHDMVGAQVAATMTTDDQTSSALARVNGQVAG